MKIGFDAKRVFSNKSGLGNYSRDVISSLIDYYPENEKVLFTPNQNTEQLEKKYLSNVIYPRKKIMASYWRSVKMGNDIEAGKIDIFHGLSNELPLNIKQVKAKKVVTIHDLIFLKFPELYKLIDCKIYNFKFKRACQNADKIIAISNQTKEDIIHYYKIPESKIEVIYQTCNQIFKQRFDDDIKEKTKIKFQLPQNFVLNVGTIEKRKNVLSVIKAIQNMDISLIIIGKETEYAKEVKSYIYENRLQDKVKILNNVNAQELACIYQLSKIFIYPSIYEGFGIPILEAFFSGVPVITGNAGATAEAGGEAVIKVNPLDYKMLEEQIIYLLENNTIKEELISKGFERTKLFEKEAVAKNIMNFYKKL
jgi:glycosyltransferase involved in cell wall biosynthesis